MKFFRELAGDLFGQATSKTDRKSRPRRAALGSLGEQLETRAMLSQVNLAPPIVVPAPGEAGPAVVLSARAPMFSVDGSLAVGADDHSGALDVVAGGSQSGVQLTDLDIIESNGQIGVQLTDT